MKTALLLDTDLVFRPKRLRGALIAVALLALGGVMAWGERGKPFLPAAPGAPFPIAQLVTDATIGFILLVGLAYLVASLAGLPRLTATRRGLTLRTLLRKKFVPWPRLGTISILYGQGRSATRAIKATAPILPDSAGKSRARGVIAIPDIFATPLTTILEELAVWHGNAGLPTLVMFKTAPERPIGIPGFRWPWLTALLFSAFILMFVLEQRLAITPGQGLSPSIATLISLGGLSFDLAHSGQWYRVLTAPFLHTGLAHIVANGIAFLFAGYALERLVGRAWTFCLFAAGALAGSFGSLAWSSPATVSVGASGAIMSMLVGLFMISFRLPPGRGKAFVQMQAARVAIPALVPVFGGAGAASVDYGAHFGGAGFGGLLGLLLLLTWEEKSALPTLRAPATAFAIVAAVSFLRCGYEVANRHAGYNVVASWIPPYDMPRSPQEIAARADYLLATYPRDPRAHYFVANARLQQNDRVHAEQQLKTAILEVEAFPSMFSPALVNDYRVLLATTVLDLGRRAEAMAIAHPVCVARGDAVPEPAFKGALDKAGLCERA